jgi:hypothetical protein
MFGAGVTEDALPAVLHNGFVFDDGPILTAILLVEIGEALTPR